MSTREELLASPLAREKVDLAGGKSIWVRELTAGELALMKGVKNANAMCLALGAIREDGARLFDPNDPADMALIERMGSSIVIPVAEAISRLSGVTEAAQTAKN